MKRKIVMGLLVLGTIAGFGSGFARMCHGRHRGHEQFMDRVADECVQAARRADRQDREGRRPDGRGEDRGERWGRGDWGPADAHAGRPDPR